MAFTSLTTGGQFDELSPPIIDPFKDKLKDTFFKIALPGMTPDLARDLLALPENGGVLPNGTVYPQVKGDDTLTCLFNLSPEPQRLTVTGASLTGPAQAASLDGNTLSLGPNAFAFLSAAGQGGVTVT